MERFFQPAASMSAAMPARRAGALAALLALLIPHAAARAQAGDAPERWGVELFAGAAHSFRTPLHIRQEGEEEIALTARWATRPFRAPPYYAYRVGWWSRGHAWEAELVHHKLYLENPPPEVQHFEVTHGYNQVTVNRASPLGGLTVRVGVGVVIAHTENQVRGREQRGGGFLGGYHLAGATTQLALGGRIPFTPNLWLALEGKLTGSWARVPVAGGSATVPNVAAHALAGIGVGR
ncbi:MAG TPA: hypothetical protein VFS05_09105 [Gemmatimonadaceae bacterium]|nr:hypothetical protein [Gemmatimonadaceae bacterium]